MTNIPTLARYQYFTAEGAILLPAQTRIGVPEGEDPGSGSLSSWYKPLQAVNPARGIVAASFMDIQSGIGIALFAGTRAYSANAPVPVSINAPIHSEATYLKQLSQ